MKNEKLKVNLHQFDRTLMVLHNKLNQLRNPKSEVYMNDQGEFIESTLFEDFQIYFNDKDSESLWCKFENNEDPFINEYTKYKLEFINYKYRNKDHLSKRECWIPLRSIRKEKQRKGIAIYFALMMYFTNETVKSSDLKKVFLNSEFGELKSPSIEEMFRSYLKERG